MRSDGPKAFPQAAEPYDVGLRVLVFLLRTLEKRCGSCLRRSRGKKTASSWTEASVFNEIKAFFFCFRAASEALGAYLRARKALKSERARSWGLRIWGHKTALAPVGQAFAVATHGASFKISQLARVVCARSARATWPFFFRSLSGHMALR